MSLLSLNGQNTDLDISSSPNVGVGTKEICEHCGNEIRLVRIESKMDGSNRIFAVKVVRLSTLSSIPLVETIITN